MLSSPFFEPRAPFTFEFLWFVSLLFLSWAFLPRWLGAGHQWVSLALDLLLLSRPPRSLLHHEPHPRHPLWVRKTRTDNSRVFPSRDFVRVGVPAPSPSAVLYPLWQSDQRAFLMSTFILSSNWIETIGKLDNHVLNCLWTFPSGPEAKCWSKATKLFNWLMDSPSFCILLPRLKASSFSFCSCSLFS